MCIRSHHTASSPRWPSKPSLLLRLAPRFHVPRNRSHIAYRTTISSAAVQKFANRKGFCFVLPTFRHSSAQNQSSLCLWACITLGRHICWRPPDYEPWWCDYHSCECALCCCLDGQVHYIGLIPDRGLPSSVAISFREHMGNHWRAFVSSSWEGLSLSSPHCCHRTGSFSLPVLAPLSCPPTLCLQCPPDEILSTPKPEHVIDVIPSSCSRVDLGYHVKSRAVLWEHNQGLHHIFGEPFSALGRPDNWERPGHVPDFLIVLSAGLQQSFVDSENGFCRSRRHVIRIASSE